MPEALPTGPAADQVFGAQLVLQHLEWTVLRPLDGLLQGDWPSLWRGGSLDLADLREYQLHDDVRHIDWNVTARLDTPYVRQYTQDRDLTAWFLVDVTSSMRVSADTRSKQDCALILVAALARMFTRHGNRVGALIYDGQTVEVLRPGSSRTQVLTLLQRLRLRSRDSAAAAMAVPTDLSALLSRAQAVIRQRCMVFVVSDFLSRPGWEQALGRLGQRHDLMAVVLSDPLQRDLSDWGLITVEDAETGEQLFIDTDDPTFCDRYTELAEEQHAALLSGLADCGVDILELQPEDEVMGALMRVCELRRQRARRPAPRRFGRSASPVGVTA